eukprot:SAG31_NODE_2830_length_5027_cov_3.418425_3_plen_171_part_00
MRRSWPTLAYLNNAAKLRRLCEERICFQLVLSSKQRGAYCAGDSAGSTSWADDGSHFELLEFVVVHRCECTARSPLSKMNACLVSHTLRQSRWSSGIAVWTMRSYQCCAFTCAADRTCHMCRAVSGSFSLSASFGFAFSGGSGPATADVRHSPSASVRRSVIRFSARRGY